MTSAWRSAPRLMVVVGVALAPLLFNLADPATRAVHATWLLIGGCLCIRTLTVTPVVVAAAALGFGALAQLVPLPIAVADALQPGSAAVLGLVRQTAELSSSWRPLSLDPPSAALEGLRALGLAALAAAVVADADLRRLSLAGACAAAAAAAAIAVAHIVVDARGLFGRFDHAAMRSLPSVFGNENHGASALVVGAALSAGFAHVATDLRAKVALSAAAVVEVVLVVRAGSRGGLVALVVCAVVGMVLAAARGAHARRGIVVVGGALAVTLALAVGSSPRAQRALSGLAPAEIFGSHSKLALHGETLRLVREHWPVGIGRGAYEAAHPRYIPELVDRAFSHIECEPLAALAELGVPLGLAVILVVCAALVLRLRAARAGDAVDDAAAAAAVALAVHSLVDFHLALGGAVTFVVVLAAPRSSPQAGVAEASPSAAARLAVVAGVFAGALASWGLPALADDRARVRAAVTAQADLDVLVRAGLSRRPVDAEFVVVVAAEALARGDLERAARLAELGLVLHPTRGPLWATLGVVHLEQGRRERGLRALRKAGRHGVDVFELVWALAPDKEAFSATTPDAAAWARRLRARNADALADGLASPSH